MNQNYEQLNTATADSFSNPFTRSRKGGYSEISRGKNRLEKYILIFYCNFRKILFFPIKYSYKLHKVSAAIIIINGTAFNKYLELLSQKAKNKIVPIKIRYKIVKGSITSFFLMRIIPPVSINVKSIFQYILLYVFIQILTKLDS